MKPIYGRRIRDYICQGIEYDYASTANFSRDGNSLDCGQTPYEALCKVIVTVFRS